MKWLSAIVDYGVLGLLLALSVATLAVALERLAFFRGVRADAYPSRREFELALTDKLLIVGSVASTAPFLGLLGTVLGIMLTFYDMGMDAALDTGRIMVGLALALKATAIGLVVALVAMATYNALHRRVQVFLMRWDIAHEPRHG